MLIKNLIENHPYPKNWKLKKNNEGNFDKKK